MIKKLKDIYVHDRFFILIGITVVIFASGFVVPPMFLFGKICLAVILALFVVDFLLLFSGIKVFITRTLPPRLSLGDVNKISLHFEYSGLNGFQTTVYEDPPSQTQLRNISFFIPHSRETCQLDYEIIPEERGIYMFGKLRAFISSPLKILERRFIINSETSVAVYPSILQMKKLELSTFKKTAVEQGVKKIRRLGHNNEFEQIRTYVQGDDYRIVNWKASSRKHELMVNQYQDEKAQRVYSIIDKSRNMRNPFEGLTLLDHTINSVLALSNVIIKKGDRAGLITFSDKMGNHLKAERSTAQLKKINEVLYKQQTNFLEADFELLYQSIRRNIKGRSILILYTNFESESALKRTLPVLRMLNKNHLLIVILFENTEVTNAAQKEASTLKEVYFKTIAEKYTMEKKQIVYELRKYGIQAVLTNPEKLTVDTLNKYLEIKSKGMG